MMASKFRVGAALLAAVPPALAGCASLTRGAAVPFELQDSAVVPGLDAGVRTWGGQASPRFMALVSESVSRERQTLGLAPGTVDLPPANFLALSGGGSDGAFGAGLLCGWTEKGDRPEFKVVTGISTGALMAPLVFLGPKHDEALRTLYTQTTTADILTKRGALAAIFEDALADTKPLAGLLAKVVDEPVMEAIAAEHRKGRVLIIGTTNLDARRAVLWNIGEIAASGAPGSLDLIRKILIASAAIPAAFPPVLIDVVAGEKKYQEMHVDGGAMTQVFLYPPSYQLAKEAKAAGISRERRAYIIRNARIDPNWSQVDRRTLTIAGKAISSLIATQGIGDLYRMYLLAQRDGVDFNLAFIPATFTVQAKEEFDKVYMGQLFEVGYQMGRKGYPWQKTPPLYETIAEGGAK